MFGRVDFREDGKNEEGKLFGECLVKREREENYGGIQVFFSWIHQKVCSPKWEEKWMRGNLMVNEKNAHVHFAHAHAHGLHPVHSFLLFFSF